MQFDKASVEFRLITRRYLKDLRYKLNTDAIKHHQASYMLLLSCSEHNQELIKQIVGSHDDSFSATQAAMEFGLAKVIHRNKPTARQSDHQKTNYLQTLTQDQSFKSLSDIINRMKQIHAPSAS